MKPILFIALIGAAAAMSFGYLGNEVSLDAQEFGVGATDFESPVDDLRVDIVIERLCGVNPIICLDFKDRIVECSFMSDDEVEKDSTITCKLLDAIDGNLIAEGKKLVDPTLPPLTPFTIPIDHFEFTNANDINNVHDMIIVIQGPP